MENMNLNTTVINYRMYEDSEDYLGLVQVTLPSLQMITQTVKGAGLAGEIETVIIGQMKAMQIQFQLMVLTRQGINLTEQRIHTWEFREAQQTVEGSTGVHDVEEVKHIFRAFPKQMDGGTLAPQGTSNPNVAAAVYYWAEYRNGEKVLELDPFNYICFINGTDYLEKVRKALGM